MIAVYRALLGRALGRLASDRVALIGAIVAILALALGASVVAVSLASGPDDAAELGAILRSAGWRSGSRFFDAMIWFLAVGLGLTVLNRDRTNGTVFGILARPVSRLSVFLSTWMSVLVVLSALELVRSGALIVSAAWFEGAIDPLHVLAAVAGLTGVWLLSAAFFALGAAFRTGYAGLAGIVGLYLTALAFEQDSVLGGPALHMVNAAASFLPLAKRQSKVVTATLTGTAVDAGPILEVILYRLSWIALLLFVGAWAFSRRDVTQRG